MLLGPHFLEAADGRRRQTRRVPANEGRQHFLEVAGRDALQVEDRDQHLKALRPARIPRQDRWRVADALALGSFAVAHPRLANRDRADASHDLAFRKMAMAHDALMARRGPEIGILCRNSATSASTAWVSALAICHSRGLSTQRRRRSDPNGIFPTRSAQCVGASLSPSPGPCRDAPCNAPIRKIARIPDY